MFISFERVFRAFEHRFKAFEQRISLTLETFLSRAFLFFHSSLCDFTSLGSVSKLGSDESAAMELRQDSRAGCSAGSRRG